MVDFNHFIVDILLHTSGCPNKLTLHITTSNIKQLPRHPMDFKEKVRHMVKMGIPKNRIVMEKSPYVAVNLFKKFNSDTTTSRFMRLGKDKLVD